MTEAEIKAAFLALPNDPWFPSTCKILVPGAKGPSGLPVSPSVSLGGSTDAIPCRVAPIILQRPSAVERRTTEFTATDNSFHCVLKGYFPTITDSFYALIYRTVEGIGAAVLYRIASEDTPGNAIYTRLRVERVAF